MSPAAAAGTSGVVAALASSNPALAWFQAASPLLAEVMGGGSGPAAPSSASSYTSSSFDNSGFSVRTGSGAGNATSSPASSKLWIAVAGLLALGAIVWLKKH